MSSLPRSLSRLGSAAYRLRDAHDHQAWYRAAAFCVLGAVFALILQSTLVHGLRHYGEGNVGVMNRVLGARIDAEILISGSSRATYHYDPRIIEARTKLTAFNIGRNGTKLHEQLQLLRVYLPRNKRPAYLIQNLDITTLLENDDVTDPKQYIAWLDRDEIYRPLVQQKPYFIVYRLFPLAAMVRTAATQAAVMGLLDPTVLADEGLNGYAPQYRTWNEDFARFRARNPHGLELKIDPRKIQTLADLLEICARYGIQAILVVSPEYVETRNFIQNRAEALRAFREIADRFHVPFWDYSNDPMCKRQAYFYNSQHLNHEGAKEFSELLAQRLVTEIGASSISSDQKALHFLGPGGRS